MRRLKLLVIAIVSLGCSSAFAATMPIAPAVLDISSGGILQGATGVSVSGLGTYDVVFRKGSCIYWFDDCNADTGVAEGARYGGAGFAFSTAASANAAASALLAQVLLGIYDIDPTRVNGCGGLNAPATCQILTPYAVVNDTNSAEGLQALVRYAANNSAIDGDAVNNNLLDILGQPKNVHAAYAQWTQTSGPQLTATPIPAALPLFLTGIAAIGWFRRRKVQA